MRKGENALWMYDNLIVLCCIRESFNYGNLVDFSACSLSLIRQDCCCSIWLEYFIQETYCRQGAENLDLCSALMVIKGFLKVPRLLWHQLHVLWHCNSVTAMFLPLYYFLPLHLLVFWQDLVSLTHNKYRYLLTKFYFTQSNIYKQINKTEIKLALRMLQKSLLVECVDENRIPLHVYHKMIYLCFGHMIYGWLWIRLRTQVW